ncbi:glycosyltransferase family 2 protein [Paenibacillus sp. ACRRX]|uniref:glycosyltransferase family 2 protein n=1 Tax=unclassified Paenibacillus TaxID=185978 RepID=UPI001EF71D16|nr:MULTISPECIES: glycosyltransferase family 2 protein [unclassified Paenibacillus]MCG7410067.1 glycosyltransferase family 2 protein [Paenibacillus sp. ACRRX]MDK8183641.1 glycosyltransferase family 2 protein [Paenibacillus sp. UMB4589-SE434]
MTLAHVAAPLSSIIIPTYNRCELLRHCVSSIRKYTDVPYEIIVVDNHSSDGTRHYCIAERLTYVSLPENRGFPAACNAGMLISSGDTIVLLNNDVVVSHYWLRNLSQALMEHEEVGIVGPTTNYASGRQQVNHPYEDLEQFHRLAAQLNQPDRFKRERVQRVVGLCFALKRKVLDTIGLLDEQFNPGHYEDDDFCLRARMSGYGIMMCGDVFVHHYGSHSFKQLGETHLRQLVQRNYELFKRKWNIDPHHFM